MGGTVRRRGSHPVAKSTVLERLRAKASSLRSDTYALSLATRDSRVPWPAKLVAAITVAYALSPIDLIPDFIPVIGYLDDLVLVPLGIALSIRLIPRAVFNDLRAEAARRFEAGGPSSRVGAALVLAVWFLAALWLLHLVGAFDAT